MLRYLVPKPLGYTMLTTAMETWVDLDLKNNVIWPGEVTYGGLAWIGQAF